MKKNQFQFTEGRLKRLSSVTKKTRFYDEEVKGLVLVVYQSGTKVFYIYKRIRGSERPVSVRIGNLSDVPLKSAREQALRLLTELRLGINPNQQHIDRNQSGLTLLRALNEYIDVKRDKLSDGTLIQYRAAITNYSPHLLNRKVKDITRQDIQSVHAKVTQGKCTWRKPDGTLYRMKKPSPSQADLWGRAMRAIINYAMDMWRGTEDQPLIVANPVKVLSTLKYWNKVQGKTTRISNDQLKAFFDVLESFRASDRLPSELAIADALEMAIFTGLRLNEVMGLTKSRVDVDKGVFWISETKNGCPVKLPITESIKGILERRFTAVPIECDYLFPSKCGTKPIQDSRKTIANLRERSLELGGVELTMNFHDMRRTFASTAAFLGVNHYMIKRLVNHKMGNSHDVTEEYMHFHPSEVRVHAEKIERFILEKSGRIQSDSADLEKQLLERVRELDDDRKRSFLALLST
ncbi:tyrosine-type recombinase/integrase [Vibrio breoganii]|uniref:tyrosine-type recombinase/integrase n=1 Tax=Vibrio breoganii TaxID=553239 RepID=UPI0003178E52|nr:tyrosine-type recombinase/integrase [Vibrio breoganii]OEF87462.1 hypothetical protein B003_03065 [Vibrio breoganii 1C10]